MIVNDDSVVLGALERDLGSRYTPAYRLVRSTSGDEALAMLDDVCNQGEPVALVVAQQEMVGMNGARFLLEARRRRPEAGHVLLASASDACEAMATINQGGLDCYLAVPWDPPAEKLYPLIDELLDDWVARTRIPYLRVSGVMDVDVVTIPLGATLHEAATLVATSGVGDLMVIDDEGGFGGVLSESDILRNTLPHFDDVIEAGGTLYDAYQLFVQKGQEFHDKPIAPLVITDPLVMGPDDHVAKAATLLLERKIRRLPIVAGGRLLGTVSRANICRAVVGDP